MKNMNFIYVSFLALLQFSQWSAASELKIDPAHSEIGFEVKHLVVSSVHGSFTDFNGKIDLDDKDLTKSKVNFNVKVSSISTANTKRDDHLKSAEFFNADKFPEAKFESTLIKKTGKDKYLMTGDLTIHGVTKKANFDMSYLGKTKDPWGTEKIMFQAITELNRKDYGLTWNKTLETGGVLIGEKVKLNVSLETEPKSSGT